MFDARCQHLLPDGRCNIYEDRPTICRSHSNDYCEYDAPAEDGFDLYFPDYDSLLQYCRKRFKRWSTGKSAAGLKASACAKATGTFNRRD